MGHPTVRARGHPRSVGVAVATALLVPAAALASGERSALAQERYDSSYGDPAPVTAAQPARTPAPQDDGTPWMWLAIGAGALALTLAATQAVTLTRLRRPRPI